MDNEHYLDMMAAMAMQGLLSTDERIPYDEIVTDAYKIAEKMWEEREKLRAARAAYLGKKNDWK